MRTYFTIASHLEVGFGDGCFLLVTMKVPSRPTRERNRDGGKIMASTAPPPQQRGGEITQFTSINKV